MPSNEKIISGLQRIVTDLSQQADAHCIQSHIFGNQGFKKLANKYAEHTIEERGYVEKCIDRILDLGSEIKLESKKEVDLYKNPIDFIKHDLQVSKESLPWLKELVEESKSDYATFDILKAYYIDEEEDMNWTEAQLELIKIIGEQNWILQQL